jgi:cell division protein FtsW
MSDPKTKSSATKKRKWSNRPGIDLWLVLTVSVLLLIGLLAVFSVTYMQEFYRTGSAGDPMAGLTQRVVLAGFGVIIMLIISQLDYHLWKLASLPMMVVVVAALIIVLVLPAVNGSHRWLFNGKVQPSELAKLAMVIYIAHWASSKGEKIRQVEFGLLPFGLMVGIVTALILSETDLSTSVLIVLTSLVMFYIAGADNRQFALTTIVGSLTVIGVVGFTGYQMDRIEAWLHPTPETILNKGYQQYYSKLALSEGGLFGQGLGHSHRLWASFPSVGFDYIFSVVGNETGLIGGLLVIGLFMLLAYRGFTIAMEADDAYGTILATGITAWITLQAMMHVAVAIAAMPVTGVTLPFISLGGSSLMISLAGVGILLSVSRGHSTGNR